MEPPFRPSETDVSRQKSAEFFWNNGQSGKKGFFHKKTGKFLLSCLLLMWPFSEYFFRSSFEAVFLIKPFYTSIGGHEPLTTGEERMAFGANFNPEFIFHRTAFEFIAACAFYHYTFVFGMNSFFHPVFISFCPASRGCRVFQLVPKRDQFSL